jgi:hypothetical protein
MKKELCCSVNTYCHCDLCGQRWCMQHWTNETETHRNSTDFTTCPLRGDRVQWELDAGEMGSTVIVATKGAYTVVGRS